jgi:CTP synthase (UTP-ammonia lyase)
VVVEIGGTTGDIENFRFYMQTEKWQRKRIIVCDGSYVPFLRNVGELKNKPTTCFYELR